jgi:hypothetical protein
MTTLPTARLANQRSNWPRARRALDDLPAFIGDRQLEDVLGEIHSHDAKRSSSMHLGLLHGDVALTPHTT